jgi:cytochrome oxidase Cu insertion factor (SCO1/SenC/PrrC family)
MSLERKQTFSIFIIGLILSGAAGYLLVINSNFTQLARAPEDLESLTGKIETPIQSEHLGNAPDFNLIDLDGNSVKLSDFKGRVVLLDFMATWCGPCRTSMPGLIALHEEVGKDVLIISISVDPHYDTEERLRDWVNEWDAKWIHVRDLADPPLMQLYGVRGIPTYIIVDRNGDIAFRHVGLTSGGRLMIELSYLSE